MSKLRAALSPCLTDDIVDKLGGHGINTVSDFVVHDVEEIAQYLQISWKDVSSIRRVLLAQFSAYPVSAADMYDDLTKSVGILSTGSDGLDNLLEGGIYTMEITEIVGELAAGKSQVCLNVAVTLAETAKQKTIWVDTCGSFNASRLHMMLDSKQIQDAEMESISGKIHVQCAYDVMELLTVLEDIKIKLADQAGLYGSVKLLVIDSVTPVLSPVGSGYSPDGQGIMMQVARSLKMIAVEYSVAVLVTNNLVGGDVYNTKKPALGRAWASIPNCRLLLNRKSVHRISPQGEYLEGTNSDRRTACLVKSCRQACNNTIEFDVTDIGLQDIS